MRWSTLAGGSVFLAVVLSATPKPPPATRFAAEHGRSPAGLWLSSQTPTGQGVHTPTDSNRVETPSDDQPKLAGARGDAAE